MKIKLILLLGIFSTFMGCEEIDGIIVKIGFPIILQKSSMQCGPICLQMISKYHGKEVDVKRLEIISKMDKTGTSLLGLEEAADSVGLESLAVKLSFEDLIKEAPLPAILHWNMNHFVVVYHATKTKIYIADPAYGKLEYSKEAFCKNWIPKDSTSNNKGIILLLEPTSSF
ncbi:MAG: cysteine peptidase family C39 domain-containing protein [Saprospiraceae bacterium]